jgi:hypothetical protein
MMWPLAGHGWLAVVAICLAAGSPITREADSEHARFFAESHAAMQKMMAAMDARPTGDVDADFAAMMISHHAGAIEMAQALLRTRGNRPLRRLAQEIIITQQQETAVMRLALQQRAASGAHAVEQPGNNLGVGHRDRVYAAEQFSNTVSVTDPADNRLLGVIRLGDPAPGNLSPLYRGQLLVHGMGVSPTYVGRSSHEAFFTPDGNEVWVTVRGESYVAVLDATTYVERGRIDVPNGPGMQIFRVDS